LAARAFKLTAHMSKSDGRHWNTRNDVEAMNKAIRHWPESCIVIVSHLEPFTAGTRHAKAINPSGHGTSRIGELCGEDGERSSKTVARNEQRLVYLLTPSNCLPNLGPDGIERRLKARVGIRVGSSSNVKVGCQRFPHRWIGARKRDKDLQRKDEPLAAAVFGRAMERARKGPAGKLLS